MVRRARKSDREWQGRPRMRRIHTEQKPKKQTRRWVRPRGKSPRISASRGEVTTVNDD